MEDTTLKVLERTIQEAARVTAQRLRACATLTDVLGLIPSVTSSGSQLPVTPGPGDPMLLASGLLVLALSCIYPHADTHIHIIKNNF